jgi:hypothetical protein
LSNVVASKKDGKNPRRLNLHVIFSDELPPEQIEDHFLHNLEISTLAIPQVRDFKEKLKESNLVLLGETIKSESPNEYKDRSALEVGATVATVDHECVTQLLMTSTRFTDKYLIVMAEEGIDLVEWGGQDHNLRRILMQKSDMIFTSNSSTIN